MPQKEHNDMEDKIEFAFNAVDSKGNTYRVMARYKYANGMHHPLALLELEDGREVRAPDEKTFVLIGNPHIPITKVR